MKPRPGSSSAGPARIGPVEVGRGQWTEPELKLLAAEAGKARDMEAGGGWRAGPGC